jgi:hypothetical protein
MFPPSQPHLYPPPEYTCRICGRPVPEPPLCTVCAEAMVSVMMEDLVPGGVVMRVFTRMGIAHEVLIRWCCPVCENEFTVEAPVEESARTKPRI